MSNPHKRRGDQAERQVVDWLRANGYPHAARIRAGWEDDMGDIDGVPGVVIDVKARKELRIGEWVDHLDDQMTAAHTTSGLVIVKRRGITDVGEWIAACKVRTAL